MAIDTVWGIDSTTYLHLLGDDPCDKAITYAISAIDSCDNLSPKSPDHNTIKVFAEPDICEDKMNVSWNAYINMDPALGGYDIMVSENGGPYSLLSNVGPTVTSYEHLSLNDGSYYCYLVRAHNSVNSISSTSCEFCLYANKPNQPQFIYLMSASVNNENSYVELKIHTDVDAKVTEYRVMRSVDNVTFNQVAALPPSAVPLITYQDVQAQVKQVSYYYNIIIVDSCGVEVMTSNTARSVLLKVVPNEDLTNTLSWNDYEGYLGSPTTYDVYRKIDGVLDPTPIVTGIPATVGEYIDDVAMKNASAGRFEYYVQAIEGAGNTYLFNEISQSNTTLSLQKPRLFVPSAFIPASGGANAIFLPYGVYVDSRDYLFQVFNRWGDMVYETRNVSEGWNGRYKDQDAPSGVYVYLVRFKTSSGEYFEKRGTVTLLR
jgi:gliding motility-associated-like protein